MAYKIKPKPVKGAVDLKMAKASVMPKKFKTLAKANHGQCMTTGGY